MSASPQNEHDEGHAATDPGTVVQWDPAEQGDNMLGLQITEDVEIETSRFLILFC